MFLISAFNFQNEEKTETKRKKGKERGRQI
jgi:hypothetical protein